MQSILTINAGSSSIRFAFYQAGGTLEKQLHGKVDRIGSPDATLTFKEAGDADGSLVVPEGTAATEFLLNWVELQPVFKRVTAVGHRIVHGMHHTAPERITEALLEELRSIRFYDPEHLPREIELIEAIQKRHPQLAQTACFDTAFHQSMPRVAKMMAIPRRYEAKGVQRYGFHGLSYAYLMEELVRLGDHAATSGRVILAHLGNGASMAAVCEGQGMDTSMGFTPTSGLVMSTRCGDLDPGLVSFLSRTEGMRATQFQHLANHESGLLGVSETSSDMRDLLTLEDTDVRAAEAVALFCYQAKKWIGSFAAILGGIDTLVFAGGMGENSASVRARICAGLEFLGIEINAQRNENHEEVISSASGRVHVRVIHTDEEVMIARLVLRMAAP
ncbi:MAG: acetate kinase [Verrucomicrobia bacterium 12-59-8]|nr:MAG: acetate kinase [Verrucomicrobia bacterium 12-59-8]